MANEKSQYNVAGISVMAGENGSQHGVCWLARKLAKLALAIDS
jgi:hypothetical protein